MIALHHICVSFGEKQALRDVSLQLPQGGVVAITGPSGIGKTTLLRVLAGLLPPDSGYVSGMEGRSVSMVFQEDRLLPWYSAYENVLYALPHKCECPQRVAREWLVHMELADSMHMLPGALSGGMQRRVAIARACAVGGDILLLDEPFKGMDEALRLRVAAHIRKAVGLIVMVTHDIEDAHRMDAALLPLQNGPPLHAGA